MIEKIKNPVDWVDHFTPYYKVILNNLPAQARSVFYAALLLSRIDDLDYLTTRSIAKRAGMSVHLASTNLMRLTDQGLLLSKKAKNRRSWRVRDTRFPLVVQAWRSIAINFLVSIGIHLIMRVQGRVDDGRRIRNYHN